MEIEILVETTTSGLTLGLITKSHSMYATENALKLRLLLSKKILLSLFLEDEK